MSIIAKQVLKQPQALAQQVLKQPQAVAQQVLKQPQAVAQQVHARAPNRFWDDLRFVAVFSFLTAFSLISHAAEGPRYQVVQSFDGIEIRAYQPYVVAEVVLDAPAERAGNLAFPILAGYIFGGNKGERRFAMTSPVTQSAVPVRMDMTSPVTRRNVAGRTLVQFVLPRGVTLRAAPEPLDSRVQLREVPAGSFAVVRYAGTWSTAAEQRELDKMRAVLDARGIKTGSVLVTAQYDGPRTPRALRRNEVWLPLL